MLSLQVRMYLLLAVLFGIVYMIATFIGASLGITNFYFYVVLAFVIMFIQYLIGPKLIEWSMHVRYVDKNENPQ